MENIYIETYGCQMNFADSEVIASILTQSGYGVVDEVAEADFILINTCAIRDNAEQRVRHRVRELRALQNRRQGLRVGVLGCMAERLQSRLMAEEDNVSFVCGPDAYRRLPEMLQQVRRGQKAAEVELSTTETYADIEPVRLAGNGISAYISIMRGCQNYCAYCVVPYTRGRERSRDPETIVREARTLFEQGYREVTLLGQNVNSYHWEERAHSSVSLTADSSLNLGEQPDGAAMVLGSSPKLGEGDRREAVGEECVGTQQTERVVGFPELMERVAEIDPRLRVRFATSHPKDLSDKLLEVMARHANICRCIHLPVQSGSNRMLKLMNRKYTVEWYLDRVAAIKRYMPDCSITTDVIAGFSTETLEDHEATLELFRKVRYDYAYMFKYSLREGTYAWKHLADDIAEEEKTRRLNEIIALQGEIALENNQKEVGREYEVLVEGESHRSKEQLFGRNSQNKVVVFDRGDAVPGTYRRVRVERCTAATLIGQLVQ
ncbi:MAG: tRNA (N6-isopentenyl adenosine(37)-C2)-methylthiotransferase MiaB [Bacteroidales bacterium]|nr:tRNA (N6-isopentenyl adenosine(37)-C2)-methylthiotransferase MiaB [Bacteroidales bacterium]